MSDDPLGSSDSHAIAPRGPLVETQLVVWYFLAALAFLFISMLGGILMALQLVSWNPLKGIELFSPGRWRMVHTNAVAYGFLANAFLGCLHWAVPRLTLKPVLSRPLSYFIFFAWQMVVLVTAVGILAGYAQGVEWGETPVLIDPLALVGLLLVAINFMAPIVPHQGPAVRFAVVFHGDVRLDVSHLRDGQFHSAVLCFRHDRPARSADYSFTTWSVCSSRRWVGA